MLGNFYINDLSKYLLTRLIKIKRNYDTFYVSKIKCVKFKNTYKK